MAHKAGFVNIVGNPNVGKSTIMNALVGEKISIITSKAQTTRHRIMGIVNSDDFQIIYSDTPGVLKPQYKLQETMLRYAQSAIEDADVMLYVTDVIETGDKNLSFIEAVKRAQIPVLLLINKIDLADESKVKELSARWQTVFPDAEIIPLSALKAFNINTLLEQIMTHLPESPPYFPKDQLTDRSERFFVSEIVREKIFLNYRQEIPYSSTVEIESFKEEEDIIRIGAVIHVERKSQKGIIIGHRGKAIKKVGIEARKELEAFFEKKIFLELFVKVTTEWRQKSFKLSNLGYAPNA